MVSSNGICTIKCTLKLKKQTNPNNLAEILVKALRQIPLIRNQNGFSDFGHAQPKEVSKFRLQPKFTRNS